MSTLETNSTAKPGKYMLWLALTVGILLVGFLIIRVKQSSRLQPVGDFISAQTLAAQYGVQVNLVAVTAAGGLVDLRLKILSADKAGLLLQDSGDIPTLLVGDGEAMLTAPEDATGQLLNSLMDDGNVFLTYPNLGNVVKPGMVITVQFDDVHLEPITVK